MLKKELKMTPIPDYGSLMTWDEYLWMAKHGAINNFDGEAFAATTEGYNDEKRILPSNAKRGELLPESYTHVMWFNN